MCVYTYSYGRFTKNLCCTEPWRMWWSVMTHELGFLLVARHVLLLHETNVQLEGRYAHPPVSLASLGVFSSRKSCCITFRFYLAIIVQP